MKKNIHTLIVGLTGQTGAGKTTVRKMFAERGAAILDADEIARETIENSGQCLSDLVLEYSTEIITPEATLNRPKLAALCFSDPQKLKRLNEITYPHIIHSIEGKIKEICADGAPLLILDAPTLYESGLDKRCNLVAAVLADEEKRIARIIARDSLTDENARMRVNAQNKDAFYTERANYILKNNEGPDALRFAFLDFYRTLEEQMQAEEDGLDQDTAGDDFAELIEQE